MTFATQSKYRKLCLSAGLLAAAVHLTACNVRTQPQQTDDQQIQQQAARTTEQVKAGAKVAAADAKVATAEAGRKLKDIAAGVRQGLHDDSNTAASGSKPNAGRIDLNSATQDELAALPGITASKAQDIINARPYESSHDLVTKGLLSESHYEKIARRLTAR